MTTWGNICRICSSPAEYNIFAKIPTYLHGSHNEYLNYQKPINVLLEETTGLKGSHDDGLPSNICALCISYLKHAVTFREQCIKNAISLKLIEIYQQKSGSNNKDATADKENELFTADQLRYVEQRPVDNLLLNNSIKLETTDKVHKQLLNQTLPQQRGNNGSGSGNGSSSGSGNGSGNEQRIHFLNALLNKHRNSAQAELPSTSAGSGSGNGTGEDEDYAAVTSSDDNEENALQRKHKNCYNYSETNFEEDDPMEQAQLRDIKVNIPEPMWKERKCPACCKRYMHEDTHQLHLDNCVEYQFFSFAAEMNRLLDIKQQKMVSPHEFIRRMIFALHKICTWLQEHSIDAQLADKLNQVKITNGTSEKATEPAPVAAPSTAIKSTWLGPLNTEDDAPFTSSLLKLSGSNTPITVENNVLYAIERSESRNSQQSGKNLVVKKPIPIRCSATATANAAAPLLHEERASFLEKLQRATVTPQDSPVPAAYGSTLLQPFSAARCNQCNLVFDSVTELEIHNVRHHNVQSNGNNNNHNNALNAKDKDDDAQRRRIIALFEDDI
ncbi:uncharacterized protein LOC117565238 [Drosophila albomicans]|uniref:Uncharacterized protein LOC117565238 n=1 Tax=Drosophila albomicans TaxID=7291 RepID=A0A6P8XPG6_DROAB|nr:uncharacterized protein LOC117565238 [Drosophila albomicans]